MTKISFKELARAVACIAICFATTGAVASQGSAVGEFIGSLSPTELKVPKDMVVRARNEAGQALPTAIGGMIASPSRLSSESQTVLAKISGTSTTAVVALLTRSGIEPVFTSSTRPYATAELTAAEIWSLAQSDSVTAIRYVVGPRAQGQTEASDAHRVPAFETVANDTEHLNGALAGDGAGVVIGLISLPVKRADLALLDAEGDLIPAYAPADIADKRLFAGSGAIDETNGSADALNMLQIIHDLAPSAIVVLGSPGRESTPGQMASVINSLRSGNGSPGDEDYIPPANIIVDDLLYPTQNPFEVDEVAEAMASSRSSGVMHLSAAGDGGHYDEAASTSSVYFADFSGALASDVGGFLDATAENYSGFETVHVFGGTGILKISEDLDDLCLFWSESEDGGTETLSATAYAPDGTPKALVVVDGIAPGGCLSDSGFGGPLTAKDYVVLEDLGGAASFRLALVGYRADTGLTGLSAVFDQTTAGNILGHAYSEHTVTIAATELCSPSATPLKSCFDTTLEPKDYSADGEALATQRFFWESNGLGGFQEFSGLKLARKPELAMASFSAVSVIEAGAVSPTEEVYSGTSASVAAAAGAAALLWEYRETQIDQAIIQGPIDPGHVAQGLIATAINPARPADGASEPPLAWDAVLGWGVADLPRVIEAPTPALDVALTTDLATAALDFKLAINDIGESFDYEVDCGAWFSKQPVEPSDATQLTDGIRQAPIILSASTVDEISCTVTSSLDGVVEKGVATASIPSLILPPTVTLTAKAAGALLTVNASASESQGALTYSAACQIDGKDIILDGGNSVDAGEAVPIAANPGAEVRCFAIAVAGDNQSDPSEEAVVTALSVSATTISLTPDLGGVVLSLVKDSNLADPALVEVVVTCVQNGQPLEAVDGLLMTEAMLFVGTESESPITCEATSRLNVNGVISDVDTVISGGATVTPEPASNGLPIWLLYQATQP